MKSSSDYRSSKLYQHIQFATSDPFHASAIDKAVGKITPARVPNGVSIFFRRLQYCCCVSFCVFGLAHVFIFGSPMVKNLWEALARRERIPLQSCKSSEEYATRSARKKRECHGISKENYQQFDPKRSLFVP